MALKPYPETNKRVASRYDREGLLATGSGSWRWFKIAMQYVGVKVSPVWPRKGSCLWIHSHTLKQTLIPGDLFEGWPPQKGS